MTDGCEGPVTMTNTFGGPASSRRNSGAETIHPPHPHGDVRPPQKLSRTPTLTDVGAVRRTAFW